MKNQIINILKEENKALDIHEICELLGYTDVENIKAIMKILNELEDEYTVYHTNKDKFMLFNNSHLKVGKLLSTSKNFAFVDIEGDQDVFVAPENLSHLNVKEVFVLLSSVKPLTLFSDEVSSVLDELLETVHFDEGILLKTGI